MRWIATIVIDQNAGSDRTQLVLGVVQSPVPPVGHLRLRILCRSHSLYISNGSTLLIINAKSFLVVFQSPGLAVHNDPEHSGLGPKICDDRVPQCFSNGPAPCRLLPRLRL